MTLTQRKKVFEKIKNQINAADFIEFYEETPPYDTFIYRNGSLALNWEAEKRKLYKEFDLKHWTGDW